MWRLRLRNSKRGICFVRRQREPRGGDSQYARAYSHPSPLMLGFDNVHAAVAVGTFRGSASCSSSQSLKEDWLDFIRVLRTNSIKFSKSELGRCKQLPMLIMKVRLGRSCTIFLAQMSLCLKHHDVFQSFTVVPRFQLMQIMLDQWGREA